MIYFLLSSSFVFSRRVERGRGEQIFFFFGAAAVARIKHLNIIRNFYK
jgi:hypothetical protein